MIPIDVWNIATFDHALVLMLHEQGDLVRDYLSTSRRQWIERELSDHTQPHAINPYGSGYIGFVESVGRAMESRTIRAWHYCRMTDDEIDALRRTGITLSTIETLRARLDAQVQAGALSTGDADGLFAASPFHSDQHGARADKYWMTSHPVAPDDSGVELLVGHWGGEVTYFWLRDQALIDRVAALGRGRVVEVAVPVAATRHSYSAGEAVVATFARALGCKPDKKAFDLYTARPLGPEAILSVHSDGEADYLALGSGFPAGYVDTDVGHYDEILAEMDIIRQQRR